MSHFTVEIQFQTATRDPKAFDAFLDRVADEFASLGSELDYTASLANYTATFSIPADDLSTDALIKAVSTLRTALHAADCRTPGWPSAHSLLGARAVDGNLASA